MPRRRVRGSARRLGDSGRAPGTEGPGRGAGGALPGCAGGLKLRLLLLLLELGLALLPLHLRLGDKKVPADHYDERQHDGEDGVLVLDHSALLRTFRRGCGFELRLRRGGDGEPASCKWSRRTPPVPLSMSWTLAAPSHEYGRGPDRVPASSRRTEPPMPPAGRSAHSHGRNTNAQRRRRLKGARSHASGGGRGFAPRHCRPGAIR